MLSECRVVKNFAGVAVSGTNSRQPLPSSCHRCVPAAVVTAKAAAPVVGTSLLSSLLRATTGEQVGGAICIFIKHPRSLHIGTARLAPVRLHTKHFCIARGCSRRMEDAQRPTSAELVLSNGGRAKGLSSPIRTPRHRRAKCASVVNERNLRRICIRTAATWRKLITTRSIVGPGIGRSFWMQRQVMYVHSSVFALRMVR